MKLKQAKRLIFFVVSFSWLLLFAGYIIHSGYVERLIFNRISASFAFGYLKTKNKKLGKTVIYICTIEIYILYLCRKT